MPDTAPFDAFRWAHDRRGEVVWMCQNANYLIPPDLVADALAPALAERRYVGYPYAAGDPELRQRVLADLGFPEEMGFQLTAGGTEALYMITRALLAPGDEVIASDPSYLIIHKFVELSGARTVNLPIYQPPYRLTPDRVQAAITPKTKMILLIDPLNPLGSGYPRDDVKGIAEIAKDKGIPLLNDVTYRDFAEAPTLAAEFAPEQSITVWSVSKNCGLAGMRLGGLAGMPDLVKKVARYNTNDLGVNTLAQIAATALLRTKSTWIDDVRRISRENQAAIKACIDTVPGAFLPVYPSQANMFVIDIAKLEISPETLQRELLENHQVFLRAGNYLSPTFGGRFIRASFSNAPSDIAKFVAAFPAAVQALAPRAATA